MLKSVFDRKRDVALLSHKIIKYTRKYESITKKQKKTRKYKPNTKKKKT